jgi:hypothetical protein
MTSLGIRRLAYFLTGVNLRKFIFGISFQTLGRKKVYQKVFGTGRNQGDWGNVGDRLLPSACVPVLRLRPADSGIWIIVNPICNPAFQPMSRKNQRIRLLKGE